MNKTYATGSGWLENVHSFYVSRKTHQTLPYNILLPSIVMKFGRTA
jgi:hypothetical protein